ncbi:MAG: aminotransferase class I/II-fold pyridoxal phosphate-dependent enzyme [Candidatus Omnitrophota bacterium]
MIRRRKIRFYPHEPKDILDCIMTGHVQQGRYIRLFEEEFAKYIGAMHAISVSSGRAGLSIILDALELEKGSEIIMPAYTLKDLVTLIKKKGFTVKLIDVEKDTFNMNCELLEKAITAKSKAIIATHIFGVPCNMLKIKSLARQHNIKVIEDCAHALGAEIENEKVGTLGDAAFFSFESSKLLNTFGGGMITTNSPVIASRAFNAVEKHPFKYFKILTKIAMTYLQVSLGEGLLFPIFALFFRFEITTKIMTGLYLLLHKLNRAKYCRFSNLQSLIGLKQLKSLNTRNSQREQIAKILDNGLKEPALPQKSLLDSKRVYYFYVINVAAPSIVNLALIRKKLIRKGIDCGIKSEITDNCSFYTVNFERCPVTMQLYSSNIQIPIYDDMTEKEAQYIIDTVMACIALNDTKQKK